MSLIEQWANNLGKTETENGSWIRTIAKYYAVSPNSVNMVKDIAIVLGFDINKSKGNYYQDIAETLGNETPLNGSYLARIVEITTH
jgi:hypothetical protein